jgi:hypothetical protein
VLDLPHNDDLTIVEQTSVPSADINAIPKARQDALTALPPIILDIANDTSTWRSFTRNFLAFELGGNPQALMVK